ncbi:cardiolipin synthase [Salipaludibacillus daqingensis]|uniref:cardiolipin synthase n=1 Tax=Salipaludibacillus daqingensis TaxID=3041001 RepID=UPI0024769615|nr:cardiolipin synthase [Salipaludibacillus daqingensis]
MIIFLGIFLFLILWITLDLIIGTRIHRSRLTKIRGNIIRQSHLHFFSHGDKLFDHMFQTIDKATDHIHVQFFIFRNDHIGQKYLDLLKEKAIAGVDVRLLVDFGGYAISKKEKKSLKKAGVQLAKTNIPTFPLLFYSLNERNHRKVTVIDGVHGYIGGFNVGDEYLGRDPEMGRWRDYHLYLKGDASKDLQEQFVTDWNRATGLNVRLDDLYSAPVTLKDSTPVRIVPTNGGHVIETVIELLNRAKESVFIGTPYFVPGETVKQKLLDLCERGVLVKILVPKYPDHPFVKDAAYPYFYDLVKAGADVRQFYEGFYHSKVLVIDEHLADIGTSNFDKRSFHVNKEVNCIIESPHWVHSTKQEIEKDFYESAEKITLESIENRTIIEKLKEKIATLFSPFL